MCLRAASGIGLPEQISITSEIICSKEALNVDIDSLLLQQALSNFLNLS